VTQSDELAVLAQASPAGLALATDHHFELPPFLDLIDEAIVQAVIRAQHEQRDQPEVLLVEVPPRHGKSTLISQNAPAWFLGTFPEKRVILASYEADFAGTWGMKARDLLEEHGEELYGVTVNQRSKSARRWDLFRHKGGMVTAGVGGPITGKGAHLLIVDDPIKNAEQALSEVIREKQWDWWLAVARTRLEPGAVVVVLMTRWHETDLAGMLLRDATEGGDPVRELRLPALAEKGDPLGRKEGAALWPERYTARYLEHTRKVQGPYWFSAMYQGKPTPDEGGIFNRRDFRYCEVDGDEVVLTTTEGKKRFGVDWCRKAQYCDLAASEKETADYTVMFEVWVTPENDMLVMDVVRDRIAVPDQPAFFEGHHTGGPVKFEAIGYQTGIVQTMLRRGFPAEPVYPDKDKVTRAGAAGALYRGGKVFHRRGASWLNDFELELLAFPAGEHDDQVDALAYAAKDLPSLGTGGYRQRRKGKTITGGLLSQEM
jgi:predicted phage terminase large subunit-like protein